MEKDEQAEHREIDEAIRYYDGAMTPDEAARFRARAGASDAFAQQALAVRDVLDDLAALRFEPDPKVVAEVTKKQRALWWRDRLRLAGNQLRKQGYDFVRQAEAGLEAAIEVTLDIAGNLSRLLAEPASLCLRPHAGFDFALSAAPGMKSEAISGPPLQGVSTNASAKAGVFVTSRIPGARVRIDEQGTSVTVEFLEVVPDAVVLIPEATSAEPKVVRTDKNSAAVFSDLPPGVYLLAVPEPLPL